MSAKIRYNITVKTGSYIDREGKEKGSYKTVGCVMQKEDESRFILIDPFFNFAAVRRDEKRDMVICSLMEPKDNNNQQQTVNQEEE